MKNYQALRGILSGAWLIDKQSAEALLPLAIAMLEGKSIDLPLSYAKNYPINNSGGESTEAPVFCIAAGTINASAYSNFNQAPEGSIAILPVSGPIMKYDADCGPIGSATMNDILKAAISSPKISAIVLKIDSPGGMVDGTATFADTIKSSSKPIVAFVDDGMMASAAYWIGSAATEIIASQKTDTIGSIGVYTTIADFSGYYEKLGIKVLDIYSDRSKDKNSIYKEALQGKPEGIKEELNFIADQFIKTVKGNRKGKINLEFDNPFTGKMFTAEDAITVGLIDSIGSFDQAVRRASELANQSQSTSNNKSNDTNMKVLISNAWGALISLFSLTPVAGAESVEKEIATADWEKINAELSEKNTLAQTVKELEAAAATATSAHETALAAVNNLLTERTAERDALTAEVARLGTQPGAMGSAPVKNASDKVDEKSEEGDGIANMEDDHNKEAMEILKRS